MNGKGWIRLSLGAVLAAAAFGEVVEPPAGAKADAADGPEPARGYSKRIEFHDVDLGVNQPPANDRDKVVPGQPSKTYSADPPIAIAPLDNPYGPPLPKRRRDGAERRDSAWDEEDLDGEKVEPSGWGWLWDEVQKRQSAGRNESRVEREGDERATDEEEYGEREGELEPSAMRDAEPVRGGTPTGLRVETGSRLEPSPDIRRPGALESPSVPRRNVQTPAVGAAAAVDRVRPRPAVSESSAGLPRLRATMDQIVQGAGLRSPSLSELSASLRPPAPSVSAPESLPGGAGLLRPSPPVPGGMMGPSPAQPAPGLGEALVRPPGSGALVVPAPRLSAPLGSAMDGSKPGSQRALPW
jgi:hypothetical protein